MGTFEMFDAVKAGVFDAMHCFEVYWPGKIPVATFLSSYPFGPDRPDQWDTWYTALGGKEMAREAYARHNMYWLGPIQHDDNLIHSKVPIRKFEDFKGKKIRYPADIVAFDKLQKEQGVEVIRLSEEDIAKFRRFAPQMWVKWAKKSKLAMKAFKSQLEFMKSVKMGYVTDADMVDINGKKLVF